jgi:hypothetical protein
MFSNTLSFLSSRALLFYAMICKNRLPGRLGTLYTFNMSNAFFEMGWIRTLIRGIPA